MSQRVTPIEQSEELSIRRSEALPVERSKLATRLRQFPLASLWIFAAKEAWSALFGGLMLVALIFTKYVDLPWLERYDWLFLLALAIQIFMVMAKLETLHELVVVVLFHLTGLGMELFKTSNSIGSWSYPGEAFFEIGNVPLYSGFMYAAVGSYIARSWRVMHLSFDSYPNRALVLLLAAAIYVNFFTHHYIWDFRLLLFIGIFALWRLQRVRYVVNDKQRSMPLVLAFFLIAVFIWIAENVSTYVSAWHYPDQETSWQFVGVGKLGSWTLLMVISFVMVESMYFVRSRFFEGTDSSAGLGRT